MFRKPKKQLARRVFSGNSDEEVEVEKMSVDPIPEPPSKKKANKETKSVSKDSKKSSSSSSAKLTLLSFGDDEGTLDLLPNFSFAKHAHFMEFSLILRLPHYLCLVTFFIC